LFFWRAKAQRRKEIGENLSDLPEAGRLFVKLFFGVQRKTLCVFASLRANFFFFSQSRKGAKELDKPLALWCELFVFLARKGAETQRNWRGL
jgi:hypothetical protein